MSLAPSRSTDADQLTGPRREIVNSREWPFIRNRVPQRIFLRFTGNCSQIETLFFSSSWESEISATEDDADDDLLQILPVLTDCSR